MTDQETPDLLKMIEALRAAGVPIPDDANPVQLLTALLAAKAEQKGEDSWTHWEGFPSLLGDDFPIVLLDDMMKNEYLPKFRRNLLEHGSLQPVGFVFARHAPYSPTRRVKLGQARHIILGAQGSFEPEEKQKFAHALKLLAWKTDAAAVVFGCEAWMLKRVEAEMAEEYEGRLDEHPNRIEVIMVHYERERECAYYTAQIHRDGEGNIDHLDDWECQPEASQATGRFTHFMLQNEVRP